jgi:hypothetical protein
MSGETTPVARSREILTKGKSSRRGFTALGPAEAAQEHVVTRRNAIAPLAERVRMARVIEEVLCVHLRLQAERLIADGLLILGELRQAELRLLGELRRLLRLAQMRPLRFALDLSLDVQRGARAVAIAADVVEFDPQGADLALKLAPLGEQLDARAQRLLD